MFHSLKYYIDIDILQYVLLIDNFWRMHAQVLYQTKPSISLTSTTRLDKTKRCTPVGLDKNHTAPLQHVLAGFLNSCLHLSNST